MRSAILIVCLAAGMLAASMAAATEPYEHVSSFPLLSLFVEPSVRAAGMGGCSAVLINDPAAALEHPGSLAFARGRYAVSATYVGLAPGYKDGYQYRRVNSMARIGPSVSIAASYLDLPLGAFIVRPADSPEGIGVESDTGERSYSLAAAARWGDVGVGGGVVHIRHDMGENLAELLGVSGFLNEGWRWNAGVQYRRQLGSESTLAVAASLRNAGPDLDSPEWSEFCLPAGISTGASLSSPWLLPVELIVSAQSDYWIWPSSAPWRDSDWVWRVGSEFLLPPVAGRRESWHDEAAFRFGYVEDGLTGIDGWTWGGSIGLASASGALLAVDFANVLPRLHESGDRLWQVGFRLSSAY